MLGKSKNQPLHSLGTHETPLLIACKNGLHSIARVLLDHSPKLLFISEARNNTYPLHMACSKKDTKMVEIILLTIKTYINSPEHNKEDAFSLDFRDKMGCTPLYIACSVGSFEVAKLLVEFHRENKPLVTLNVNAAINVSQRTPLHVAVSMGSAETVEVLLSVKNTQVNVKAHPADETENSIVQNHQKATHPATSKFERQDKGNFIPDTGMFSTHKISHFLL